MTTAHAGRDEATDAALAHECEAERLWKNRVRGVKPLPAVPDYSALEKRVLQWMYPVVPVEHFVHFGTYQKRVDDWMQHCFGSTISADKTERNHRFLEEALELVQAGGCTPSEAHQLVDYVFGRPVGELGQEVGGSIVTLVALCTAHGVSLEEEGERELSRIWTKSEAIRAKQAAKPKHSPLPA